MMSDAAHDDDPLGGPMPIAVEMAARERANDAAPPPSWEALVAPASADWYATAPPARAWLLRDARTPKSDGVLPMGKVGEIIAEGGAGKTIVACQTAVAVAGGSRLLGALDVATRGKVLLLLGEEDVEEARRRLYRAARASGAAAPPDGSIVTMPLAGHVCPLVESDRDGNPTDTAFVDWLRKYLAANAPWALVVVDPLSRFAGADAEKDNAAGTRFIQAVESLVEPSGGATILVCHHTNKMSRGSRGEVSASSGRGSSSLVDGARWQAALSVDRLEFDDADVEARLGEIVEVSFTKSNYSKRGAPILLRRDDGGALVPLDAPDAELVAEARAAQRSGSSERNARNAARDAERARAEQAKCALEDDALDRIMAADDPPATTRETYARLRATLGSISNDRCAAAVERFRSRRLS